MILRDQIHRFLGMALGQGKLSSSDRNACQDSRRQRMVPPVVRLRSELAGLLRDQGGLFEAAQLEQRCRHALEGPTFEPEVV
jgi:hypothetical protein